MEEREVYHRHEGQQVVETLGQYTRQKGPHFHYIWTSQSWELYSVLECHIEVGLDEAALMEEALGMDEPSNLLVSKDKATL